MTEMRRAAADSEIRSEVTSIFEDFQRQLPLWLKKVEALVKAGRPLYLFGAGKCGLFLLENLFTGKNREAVKGFIDNNPALWGKTAAGAPVVGIETAVRDNPGALALIDVFDSRMAQSMADQCRSVGLEAIEFSGARDVPYLPVLVNIASGELLHSPEALPTASLFADARSRDIYNETLLHRLRYEHYFQPDFIPARYYRAFVDAGVAYGDTFEDFKRVTGDDFDRYYMIEPGGPVMALLREYYRSDPRVVFHEAALWDGPATLVIDSEDAMGMCVVREGDGGEARMKADSLDNLLGDDAVTMIKMDIEGCELRALEGARRILTRQKPVLMICAYHKPEDLWEIPRWIKGLDLGYELHLRHPKHLVCYAVPSIR